MIEDYVSFEVASLLATSGFPALVCHKRYACGDGVWIGNFDKPTPDFKCGELVENPSFLPTDGSEIDAPTLQMALKWLREVHGIAVNIGWGEIFEETYRWWCIVINMKNGEILRDSSYHQTYEEAANTAILYVLENLM